jgi:hypothetical protein
MQYRRAFIPRAFFSTFATHRSHPGTKMLVFGREKLQSWMCEGAPNPTLL